MEIIIKLCIAILAGVVGASIVLTVNWILRKLWNE